MIWLCHVCHCSFKTKFGNSTKKEQGYMSTENLFKPSNRKDCHGVVLGTSLYLGKCWNSSGLKRLQSVAFAILVEEKSAIWAVYML